MDKTILNYCTGCRLCEAVGIANLTVNEKGFYVPVSGQNESLKKICPCYGHQTRTYDKKSVWGKAKNVYFGWSLDDDLRRKASSGGILSEVALYLLENGIVDGIIQTGISKEDPTRTETYISTSREEVIHCSGSRYGISAPLIAIQAIEKNKKYAFIGKPCDVAALKNAFDVYPDLRNSILYTMAFFCAGLPSSDAQTKLLSELGCAKEDCVNLRYRGDGWPGYATAVSSDGKEYKMDYDSSWGKILGRDIMKSCRFCLDGIGESADIACGDAWYLTSDLQPDFSEHNGRNVILCRTESGKALIDSMSQDKRIEVHPFDDYLDKLKYIQHFQYERRTTMLPKIVALCAMGRPFPKYSWSVLLQYMKHASIRSCWRTFKGTVSRIRQGKI